MPRFIVKTHKDIKGDLRWRTGVVLEDQAFQATAVVRADPEARKIEISVQGRQRKDYFATILYFFREINQSFEKLKVIEQVPMLGEPEVVSSYQHLLTLASKGIDEYTPDGSEKEYSVPALLGMVQFDRDNEAILAILQKLEKLVDQETDEASLPKTLNRIIDLKPNVAGIGVNINELLEEVAGRFIAWREKQRRSSSR